MFVGTVSLGVDISSNYAHTSFSTSIPVFFFHVGVPLYFPTPQEYALLPCGHLGFESAVTAQNDNFKAVFIASLHVR